MVETNINRKIYQRWNYTENLKDVLNDIIQLDYAEYIIVQPQEYYYDDKISFTKINAALESKNANLTIYIGSEYNDNFSVDYNRIEFKYWDSIDYFSKSVKFHTILNTPPDEELRFYNYLKDFKPVKHFTSLINIKSGRIWRLYLVNEIYKYDLYNYGNFSFRISPDEMSFINNVNGNYCYFDDPFTFDGYIKFDMNNWVPVNNTFNDKLNIPLNEQCDFMRIMHPTYLTTNTAFMANNICDFEYMICSFDIVIETIYDYFFVTEKTLRPIDAKRPFIVFSGKGYHKKLKDKYGFKLYDNIINYDFDEEDNTSVRWEKQFNELVKIKNMYTPDDIKRLTMDNVVYNYFILDNFRKTHNSDIPIEFIQYKINNEYKY